MSNVSRLPGNQKVGNFRVRLTTLSMCRGVLWKDTSNADFLERASGPAGPF